MHRRASSSGWSFLFLKCPHELNQPTWKGGHPTMNIDGLRTSEREDFLKTEGWSCWVGKKIIKNNPTTTKRCDEGHKNTIPEEFCFFKQNRTTLLPPKKEKTDYFLIYYKRLCFPPAEIHFLNSVTSAPAKKKKGGLKKERKKKVRKKEKEKEENTRKKKEREYILGICHL